LKPETKEGIIKQFKTLSEISKKINFKDKRARTSFFGLILLLSNLYFDRDDKLRKKLQRD
jgi:hypothetical protein